MPRSLTFLSLMFIAIATVSASAQDASGNSAEVYALASQWSGLNIPGETGAAGFRFGGAWRETPGLSWIADVGHHFVSDENAGFTTLMAGPRFYKREFHDRLQNNGVHRRLLPPADPFVQFMVGTQRWTQPGQPADWSMVVAPGAGIDANLTDHVTFRLIEIELTLTRGAGTLRVASGFAFRFGR